MSDRELFCTNCGQSIGLGIAARARGDLLCGECAYAPLARIPPAEQQQRRIDEQLRRHLRKLDRRAGR